MERIITLKIFKWPADKVPNYDDELSLSTPDGTTKSDHFQDRFPSTPTQSDCIIQINKTKSVPHVRLCIGAAMRGYEQSFMNIMDMISVWIVVGTLRIHRDTRELTGWALTEDQHIQCVFKV